VVAGENTCNMQFAPVRCFHLTEF